MRVLVACECSGVVRRAFRNLGHDAVSCDLLPAKDGAPASQHFQGDVRELLSDRWDLMIAHPPCTHLSSSGAGFWHEKQKLQKEALEFVWLLMRQYHIPKIAIENPIGLISSYTRKPDQIIQPWQFGHGETKATCFWLKGLPLLKPTEIVEGRAPRVARLGESSTRKYHRSKTYEGIAAAMAAQWGNL